MLFGGQREPATSLLQDIDQAREAWRLALHNFNFVAPDYIDFAVFAINAAQCRYTALLREAKNKGLTAWKDEVLVPAFICSLSPDRHPGSS